MYRVSVRMPTSQRIKDEENEAAAREWVISQTVTKANGTILAPKNVQNNLIPTYSTPSYLSPGFSKANLPSQQWLLDRQDLIRERQQDLQILTEEEYQKIFIFFSNLIQILGEQLKLRQQVIATATVFFKRFYARNSLKCIDPLLLAPTCVFLASKVEEFGVISNSRLITTCQTVVKNKFNYAYTQEFPYRTNHILECEFYLLENLDCCLIVYQPYRPLMQLIHDIGGQEDQLLALTWRVINDSLRTDVSLLYPPYQIAIGTVVPLASVTLRSMREI
uniref:Cyclin-C n=1 Tax=Timema poppense TaxID=170557 RepID=A0A7R9CF63_TIMPO|nr:unnamed protein product [Timema poppensis]